MDTEQLNVQTIRMSDGNIIKLERHDALTSVRDLAREYARSGYPDRYAVFAQKQSDTTLTGTKPRSTYENGIFLSCILRPSFFPSQAAFLGHLTATAIAGALQARCTKPIGIGWISEIYCNGKKIGRCSIEGRLDALGAYEYLIVHIALALRAEYFPMRLSDMVHHVFADGSHDMSIILAREILDRFFGLYAHLRTPSKFLEQYRQQFALCGSKVRLSADERRMRCTVTGVDATGGGLCVTLPNGDQRTLTHATAVETPARIRTKASRQMTETSK